MFNSVGTTTTTVTSQLDQFIPSHHVALLTQPVLASRSRVKKHRQTMLGESMQQDSSDSGVDLSFSTSSSIPQPQIVLHRPLSALNEDSPSEQPSTRKTAVRLRFPPVSLGRNRSMEDMLNHSSSEEREAQPRSSSFSNERETKMKRSSDGLLLLERTTQPVLPVRDDSHLSTDLSNALPTSQTIVRKPNTFTLKPLRKKPKFNLLNEPSSVSSHDDSLSTMTSSNTPRRSMKPKVLFPGPSNDDSTPTRSQSNARSHIDRQYPLPLTLHPRRGLLQQMVPFDASPSKKNNLLLRHHFQPTLHSTRPTKPSLPLLSQDVELKKRPKDAQIRFKPTVKETSELFSSPTSIPPGLRLRNPQQSRPLDSINQFGGSTQRLSRPSKVVSLHTSETPLTLTNVPRAKPLGVPPKVTRIEPLVPNKTPADKQEKLFVHPPVPMAFTERKTSLHLSRSPSLSSSSSSSEDQSRTYRLSDREDSPISVKVSNKDEDEDGWSDDSAELLYVDERYLRARPMLKTALSHLNTREEQENVLVHL